MAYDIGPKIGIDGEKEFRNSINKIITEMKTLGTEMDVVTTTFQENANSQEALTQKNEVLNKQIDAQKRKLELLQKGLEESAKKYGEADTKTLKWQQTVNRAQADLNRLESTMRQNVSMLNEIDQGTRDAATGLRTMQDSANDAQEALDSIGAGVKAGNLMNAAEQIAGVGDKIIEAREKAAGAFNDLEGTTTKVNSYFGLTGDAAEQMGGVIENVFRTGVTDSLEEVGEAVISVNNNLKDLSPAELENITNQAMNLEQIFGADMNETMRGVNALMVNFGLDAQTAMDYIVKGSQNGLDKTQELGDNLSEYAGKFAQAGYSAEEYFQLLQNGLEGGAYNLDKVNDSINEVTTRLTDGTIEEALSQMTSETKNVFLSWQNGEATQEQVLSSIANNLDNCSEKTQEMFQKWQEGKATPEEVMQAMQESVGQFSDKTKEMFQAWKNGEASQKEVINSIVSDIANAENQQEKLNLAATAFGSMGEDASAQVIESLTTLGDSYENVSGSAQKMVDDATTPMQKLQAALNDLQLAIVPVGEKLVELATKYIPPIVEGITKLVEGFLNLPGPVQTVIGVIAGVLAVLSALAPVISVVMGIITAIGTTALLPLAGIIAGVVAAVTAAILIFQNWGAITEWFGNLWETVKTKVSEAWEGIKEYFAGVAEWWSNLWETIKMKFNEIWNAILNNPIVQLIIQTLTELWNNFKETLSGVWNGIREAAAGAWELIKNVVLAPVLIVIDLVTGNFSKLKEDLSNIWENIKNAGSKIFEGLKTTLASIIEGVKNHFTTIWNAIYSTFSGIVNKIKNVGTNGFKKLKSGISDAIQSIPGIVSDIFDRVKDTIVNMASNAWQWGADFINGLKDGIMSGVESIVSGVREIGDRIRSFLHFSRPDEGPLRDYETWMPDFMEGLARGIYSNIDKIKSAASAVSGAVQTTIEGKVPNIVNTTNTGRPTVMVTHVYLGNKELTRELTGGIVKEISYQQGTRMSAKGRRMGRV